ncbi:MAG: hypothetical protein JXM70_00470, partial [Pirellulales bacterium]|nr:hypothetical protein [Pirellulales bacterium]
WWVAKSTGAAFSNQLWGDWSFSTNWLDVAVGDFDGWQINSASSAASSVTDPGWIAAAYGPKASVVESSTIVPIQRRVETLAKARGSELSSSSDSQYIRQTRRHHHRNTRDYEDLVDTLLADSQDGHLWRPSFEAVWEELLNDLETCVGRIPG